MIYTDTNKLKKILMHEPEWKKKKRQLFTFQSKLFTVRDLARQQSSKLSC